MCSGCVFFFKQKTAYDMRISDWSSDVCSSDVFDNDELSIDAVLASACLPFMFQAVEIDGEHYYDGGYMGNPALFPLAYNSDCRDVVIVQINPLQRPELPTTAQEILDRVNEITFRSEEHTSELQSLMRN